MEDNVEKKGKVNIVAIIAVIIFVVIFIVSGIKVMKYLNDNISNNDIMADLSEDILISNEVKESIGDILSNNRFKRRINVAWIQQTNLTDIQRIIRWADPDMQWNL